MQAIHLKASVAYGDKKYLTNKLVTTSIHQLSDCWQTRIETVQHSIAQKLTQTEMPVLYSGFLRQMDYFQSLTLTVKVKRLQLLMQTVL